MSAHGLTSRKIDVLRLLAEGERTIKNDLYALMNRLHLRNRAHAVSFALREGYI